MLVKGKARLGKLVNKKTATCVAVVNVNESDKAAFKKTVRKAMDNFNNRGDLADESEP